MCHLGNQIYGVIQVERDLRRSLYPICLSKSLISLFLLPFHGNSRVVPNHELNWIDSPIHCLEIEAMR